MTIENEAPLPVPKKIENSEPKEMEVACESCFTKVKVTLNPHSNNSLIGLCPKCGKLAKYINGDNK